MRKNRNDWIQEIENWQHSGKSLARYCKETGISLSTLNYWRKKQQDPLNDNLLIKLPSINYQEMNARQEKIFLHLADGLRLEFPREIDPQYLADLLKVFLRC